MTTIPPFVNDQPVMHRREFEELDSRRRCQSHHPPNTPRQTFQIFKRPANRACMLSVSLFMSVFSLLISSLWPHSVLCHLHSTVSSSSTPAYLEAQYGADLLHLLPHALLHAAHFLVGLHLPVDGFLALLGILLLLLFQLLCLLPLQRHRQPSKRERVTVNE
ncbi:uncharacterized protein isoform X2 [Salmo salar]|uniref:Uncharacterized protein isoform X2 n=1 Tax=Salmo salar TaxID=8030 RepID=A0A1S3SP38_SALSA|nr:uncharacterized protein LOC106610938 isoform X2 [Salmo salar]|eukprot:XP_014066100.1 PREDICTED: uncharacterized protein LOC106610938 isoform X2 [Salmo salar]